MAVNEVAVNPAASDAFTITTPVVLASTPWFIDDITRQTTDAQTILDLRDQLKAAQSAK